MADNTTTDDPFGLVDTKPKETIQPGVSEHKNRPPQGSNQSATHNRFRAEMESGEKTVNRAKDFLNQQANPHRYVYEVEYWLTGTDALEFDEAINEDRAPKKQPMRTQFTHPDRLSDPAMIGNAWWDSVVHRGVDHFVNDEVRNTKPFRVIGKFVAENPHYVEPKKQSAEQIAAADKLKKHREKQLAQFKKTGSLDGGNDARRVSNEIVKSK